MPYIPMRRRHELKRAIEDLALAIRTAHKLTEYDEKYAGEFNYVINMLALALNPERRYWSLCMTHGAIVDAAAEYRRRVVVPYEIEQTKKNGDIYE